MDGQHRSTCHRVRLFNTTKINTLPVSKLSTARITRFETLSATPSIAMPREASQKQSSGNTRGWWRDHFHDHPGYLSKNTDALLPGMKNKVYCMNCMQYNIVEVQESDAKDVSAGTRSAVRSVEAITTYCELRHYLTHRRGLTCIIIPVWTLNMQTKKTCGYLSSRVDTLLVHLRRCPHQTQDIHRKATATLEATRGKRKGKAANRDGDGGSSSGSGGHYSDHDRPHMEGQTTFPAGYMYTPSPRVSELQLGGVHAGPSGYPHSIHPSRSLPQLNTTFDAREASFSRISSSPSHTIPWQPHPGTQTPLSQVSSASSSPLLATRAELSNSPSPLSGPLRNTSSAVPLRSRVP